MAQLSAAAEAGNPLHTWRGFCLWVGRGGACPRLVLVPASPPLFAEQLFAGWGTVATKPQRREAGTKNPCFPLMPLCAPLCLRVFVVRLLVPANHGRNEGHGKEGWLTGCSQRRRGGRGRPRPQGRFSRMDGDARASRALGQGNGGDTLKGEAHLAGGGVAPYVHLHRRVATGRLQGGPRRAAPDADDGLAPAELAP